MLPIFHLLIVGAVFLIGLLNAINPRIMWKHFESWKAKKEPSPVFFLVRRIMGVIVMVISSSMFLIFLQ
tara:strand:- start:710 stop:916 length:207 start_codon:yes stop_codon:yes gene_type:complete